MLEARVAILEVNGFIVSALVLVPLIALLVVIFR
jgi:hypothetical protein